MSRPIQVIPPGLLGFLQLKNSGQAPSELPDTLQGVLELRDWYFQARLEFSSQIHGITNGTGVEGYFSFSPNTIIVPQGEWWWVEQYTITTDAIDSGEFVQIAPMMIPQTVGTLKFFQVGDASPIPPSTAQEYRLSCYANGFWLGSGCTLGVWCSQNALLAGSFSCNGYVRYVPMRI
jgi:hypothetical protein